MLNPKKRYLQIALNGTLADARAVISRLPVSEHIIIEAGTPFIKRYGVQGIRQLKSMYQQHMLGGIFSQPQVTSRQHDLPKFGVVSILKFIIEQSMAQQTERVSSKPKNEFVADAYLVADLKMMDRGQTEVDIAIEGGADAAIALGHAPIESLDQFIQSCEDGGIDSMVDMMNVPYPIAVLRQLKKQPTVVIVHRGVDEEDFNKEKQIPFYEIQRIKRQYSMMIAIAGGDSPREVQRAFFNDADIVVVWRDFYDSSGDVGDIAQTFLDETLR